MCWGMTLCGRNGGNKIEQKIYGYIRVSTREQNEDRQVIALREVGVPEKNIYIDPAVTARTRELIQKQEERFREQEN